MASVVALAGGNGAVAKCILDGLQAAGRYKLIVLTRSPPKIAGASSRAEYVQVQYGDDHVDELAGVLRERHVDTVVSAIGIVSDATSHAQLNLIRAAAKSGTTTRFIPSEYGYLYVPEIVPLDPGAQRWIDAANLLKSSGLKFTRLVTGFFMDYWGMPNIASPLDSYTCWWIDMFNCQAALPGDGDAIISLTHTQDLAKFIMCLLDMDEAWPEFSFVAGADISFNDFVRLAEKIRGSPFSVTYDTLSDIEQRKVTILPRPGQAHVDQESAKLVEDYAVLFSSVAARGLLHVPTENRLSVRCPDIQMVDLQTFLEESWR